ncbi:MULTISPECIES: hypothetical protein [Enterobacteriaceae]|uniref:hypothetical protein n=1 Tax=Enterobacteriaceae TaxID=543 RepID=UPI001422E241|nr:MULTISPECIES: hypothetical protein [unclassified Enterobacter]
MGQHRGVSGITAGVKTHHQLMQAGNTAQERKFIAFANGQTARTQSGMFLF